MIDERRPIITPLAQRVLNNERRRAVEYLHIADLSGKQFGRLKVIRRDFTNPGKPRWQCICICGNVRLIGTQNLTAGGTRSCGCLRLEVRRRQADAIRPKAIAAIKAKSAARKSKTRKAAA